ncbi:hypothetical protein BHE17_10455 [Planococcus maritimus]|nr:hypothetical protein AY633_02535 [Planococcus maritimus]OED32844.1 hypothetical protein BHE17_10455 [Planococcus maritimus]
MGMETATPAGTVTELSEGATRAEDPRLSEAREAAKAVPAESVRRNGHQPFLLKKRDCPFFVSGNNKKHHPDNRMVWVQRVACI